MFPQKSLIKPEAGAETYPLDESGEHVFEERAMALVALSHTPLEHRIYLSMLLQTPAADGRAVLFNARRLVELTNIASSSTVRRGLEGLIAKLSIECRSESGNGRVARHYSVRSPREILARRHEMGADAYPRAAWIAEGNQYLERAIQRVVAHNSLSRREAQVALCCVEGLTNAAIGSCLSVSEQTVKFHLRHVFIKFGVRRRTELIARLLM
jgi:DNA-binding CsgD family transcriptional regulator